jgi:hypothetical protein
LLDSADVDASAIDGKAATPRIDGVAPALPVDPVSCDADKRLGSTDIDPGIPADERLKVAGRRRLRQHVGFRQ